MLLAAALSSFAGFGCGSSGADTGESAENTGSVGLDLIAGGVTLARILYTITGPNNFTLSSAIDAQNSTTISSLIGGLPAGAGYTITLSAPDVHNSATLCTGSATFDIVANTTTSIQVHLTCRVPPTTGSLLVNGSVNVCPTLTSFSVDPLEIRVAATTPIKINARATDPDGPSPLSYSYTATGGALFNAQTQGPAFECRVPGPVTITLVVSDGDPACNVTVSQTVTCSPPFDGVPGSG